MTDVNIEKKQADTGYASNSLNAIEGKLQSVEAKKTMAVPAPVHVLPPKLQELVKQLNDANKFPVAISLSSILFTTAVAIGNRFKIKIDENFTDIPVLYICIIAPPGAMKTPVTKYFIKVLKNRNVENYKLFVSELADYQAKVKAATNEKPCTDTEPTWKQILVSDFTIEALAKTLLQNPKGIGVMVDEIAALFERLKSKANRGGDLQFILSLFTGETITINRKTSLSFLIENPIASIIGGTQPQIMKTVFTADMINNGTFDRFIYCYPEGLKKEIGRGKKISEGLFKSYCDIINNIINLQHLEPIVIGYEDDAYEEIYRNRVKQADIVNAANAEGNEQLGGVVNKADYHINRFALILQILYDAASNEKTTTIKLRAAKAAAELTDYFMGQARRVINLIGPVNNISSASTTDSEKKELINQLPDGEFKTSEALKIAMGIRPDIDLPALDKWTRRVLKDETLFQSTGFGKYKKAG